MRTQTLGTTDLKSGENRRMDCNVQPADIQVKFSGPIAGWVDEMTCCRTATAKWRPRPSSGAA